jgi:hypothetical protein
MSRRVSTPAELQLLDQVRRWAPTMDLEVALSALQAERNKVAASIDSLRAKQAASESLPGVSIDECGHQLVGSVPDEEVAAVNMEVP